MSALSHVKSNTVGDFTGTVTVFNSAGATTTANATDLVRPGDWNSAHNFFQTISGNTLGTSTASGTNLVIGATGGISASHSTAAGAATLWMSAPATSSIVGVNGISIASAGRTISVSNTPASSYVPVFPASTSSQTNGALGTSTASAWFYPFQLDEYIAFNAVRFLQSMSFVSSTVSGQQSISSQFGIYSKNADTLSQISSGSFSMALTVSSVSATISYPTGTGTAGYTYGTTTASTTAQAHSLFGTVGNRAVNLQFGNSMTLAPGIYWLGLHQRQSTTSAAVGVSSGMVGNVFTPSINVGGIGVASSANTTGSVYRLPMGPMTSTGLAGHSGTNLPSSAAISGIQGTGLISPLLTFMST